MFVLDTFQDSLDDSSGQGIVECSWKTSSDILINSRTWFSSVFQFRFYCYSFLCRYMIFQFSWKYFREVCMSGAGERWSGMIWAATQEVVLGWVVTQWAWQSPGCCLGIETPSCGPPPGAKAGNHRCFIVTSGFFIPSLCSGPCACTSAWAALEHQLLQSSGSPAHPPLLLDCHLCLLAEPSERTSGFRNISRWFSACILFLRFSLLLSLVGPLKNSLVICSCFLHILHFPFRSLTKQSHELFFWPIPASGRGPRRCA